MGCCRHELHCLGCKFGLLPQMVNDFSTQQPRELHARILLARLVTRLDQELPACLCCGRSADRGSAKRSETGTVAQSHQSLDRLQSMYQAAWSRSSPPALSCHLYSNTNMVKANPLSLTSGAKGSAS